MEKKLLFIGADPLAGGYLSHLLGRAFEVAWCDNAEEALIKLSHTLSPDLIVCDYELKGMNGLQFLLNIKNSLFRGIPILITADNSFEKVRHTCLSVGAEDYLSKPFQATALSLKILEILKKYDLKSSGLISVKNKNEYFSRGE